MNTSSVSREIILQGPHLADAELCVLIVKRLDEFEFALRTGGQIVSIACELDICTLIVTVTAPTEVAVAAVVEKIRARFDEMTQECSERPSSAVPEVPRRRSPGRVRAEILAALADSPGLTMTQLSVKIGANIRSVRKNLQVCLAEGSVTARDKKYRLSPTSAEGG
jgi:DNA-binding transcriptional ArsR family regulator